jgi:glycosyltransferase involved in cell wall biosynthesis
MPKPKIKSHISVVLATFNEERSLPDCLASVVSWAEEIILVDGSSTDKTVEIAKKYGAQVTVTDNPPIFHLNKQKAIDRAKSAWILQLDADERIPPELADEMRRIAGQPIGPADPAAYWIRRRKMFLGKWIRKGGHYPDPVIRFFQKGKARLPGKSVHEQMVVDGSVGWLRNEMIHLPSPNFSNYITKDNRYSTLMARELLAKNPGRGKMTVCRYLFWQPLTTWFSLFIRHRGYVDGFAGFVFALYSGIGEATAYVKYWEAIETGMKDVTKDWV